MHSRQQISLVLVALVLAAGVVIGCGNSNDPGADAADRSAQKPSDRVQQNESPEQARASDGGFSPYVDGDGNISLPEGYKQQWAHLGSWAVARKQGSDIFEMHDVYTPSETIAAYNQTGEFPDGAVLVKEVNHSKGDRLSTGHSAWSTDVKIWFVMIKDQKGRFKNNEHWGDGWGWALFEAKDPKKNVSAGYDTTCISCHTPVQESDWVYTYGYPGLKKPSP